MIILLITIATAAWFGWLARRAARGWVPWAVGGALLGVVTTAIIRGLANAVFIPFNSAQAVRFRIESYGIAVLCVLLLGWLFTIPLHGHHLSFWRALKRRRP